jgi:uncharacterized protein YfaS (alpha-2-macroglobulin family)
VHQDGLLLEALLDIAPDHALVPALVERIESRRAAGRWGSTLSSASALLALSRYQAVQEQAAEYRGTVRSGDHGWTLDHGAPSTVAIDDPTAPIVIETEGRGELYVVRSTVGLAEGAVEPYDRQLEVRRAWLDASGDPIDVSAITVGDLVQVEVTVSTTADARAATVQNVAIVDALPGGLEIEHPRLRGSAAKGRTATAAADHVEFLDDRVLIFTPVGREPRTFRYALRAVTAGSYRAPPVQASCMYDEGIASLGGGGRVEITR